MLKGRVRRKIKLADFVAHFVLIIFATIALFPIFWTLLSSLKVKELVYTVPPVWFPSISEFSLSSYIRAFKRSTIITGLVNSLVVAGASTLICVMVGTIAAFGVSTYRFVETRYYFLIFLLSRMVAPIALVVPFFIMGSRLGLLSSRRMLIMVYVYTNLPFYIWITKVHFDKVPHELLDAAKIDGCGELGAFARVAIWIAREGILASAMLVFLFAWNEFMFASTLILSPEARVLTASLTDFIGDVIIEWDEMCSATIITIIPALLFLALFQRWIVKGILGGALKG